MIIFFAFPDKAYYTVPEALIPRLYANCILVVLNPRFKIVGGRETYVSSTVFLSTPSYLRNTETHADAANNTHLVTINREALSDGAIEMKGMAPAVFDLGACV
ncbi:hypothetical protein C8R44DRAFT_868744 [Mycena epipterygia]|nr:hypothetical protein C8R44DRAFT_868744 [Mycena epipterygia]